MSTAALMELRRQLAEVVEGGRTGAPGVPTGLPSLDDALPGGGPPRGRLTEVVGRLGSGRTTLLRQLVSRTVAGGGWVAYVDAGRTLAPRDWAPLAEGWGRAGAGEEELRLWVVRPTDPGRASWCADVLLRSGAFELVVLDGAPPLRRSVAVRLTRLARDADAALVVAGDGERGGAGGAAGGGTMLAGAVKLSVRRAGEGGDGLRDGSRDGSAGGQRVQGWRRGRVAKRPATWPVRGGSEAAGSERRVVIAVEKGGLHRTVEVGCAIGVARRLCTHPEVPDRRPVGRGGERGARGGRGGATARAADAGHPGGGGSGASAGGGR